MTVEVREYKGQKGVYEYDISFVLPDGTPVRERRKSKLSGKTATQRFAEERERVLYRERTEVKLTEDAILPTVDVFFPQYINACRTARQKASTIEGKIDMARKWVLPCLGRYTLDKVGKAALHDLKVQLAAAGVSASHGNNVLRVATNMLRHACDDLELIAGVPKIKTFPRVLIERPFYTPSRVLQLCNAAADEQLVMVLLGAHAGLRAGEMIGLEAEDIDWGQNEIYIQRAVWNGITGLPKHNKLRRVPMTARLRAAIKALGITKGRILRRADGELTAEVLRGWLLDIETAAGLEPLGHVHVLRHSYCSNLAAGGEHVRTIMELAGHAQLSTTQRYMHLAPKTTHTAVLALERGELKETKKAFAVSA